MSNINWGQPSTSITYSGNTYSTNPYSTGSVSITTTTTTILSSVFSSNGLSSIPTGASSATGSGGHSISSGTRISSSAGPTPTATPNNAPPANSLQYCNNPRNYTFFDPSFNPTDCPGFCPTDRMFISFYLVSNPVL